ncbi:MAG: DUF4184 family protein [Terriglobales bacterium]|jgi:hypothetical protein
MPFTPAHAAAAFPFRRTRLVWSALIIGTMAPDFEYFLRLTLEGRHGHSLSGVFLLTLPLALVTLWLFHEFVKGPLVELMPDGLERRLAGYRGKFRFGGARRFALLVASILVGVLTHLAWDSFTHVKGWAVLHWQILQKQTHVPVLGAEPVYKLLQYVSTIVGLAILLVWLIAWYRTAGHTGDVSSSRLTTSGKAWPVRRIVTLAAIVVSAVAASLVRAMVGSEATAEPLENLRGVAHFLIPIVVMTVGLVWWQLVALGIWRSRGRGDRKTSPPFDVQN